MMHYGHTKRHTRCPKACHRINLYMEKHAICLWSWSLGPIWAIKKWNMDLHLASKNRQMQISELEEWREKAYHNSKIYKERTKRWHNKRIKHKEFTPRDKVLMFNSRIKLFGHGKHKSKCEGPFKVIETSSDGAVMLQDDEGNLFKVNGQCLKVFLKPQNLEEINVIEIFQFKDPI